MQSANGLVCPVRDTGGEPAHGVLVETGQCCSQSAEVGNREEPTRLFMPGQVKEGQDRGQEDTIQAEP